jgi:FkbM family methyltransferase
VLDIGAHAGTFTRECKKSYPDAYYFMIDGNEITENYVRDTGIDYKIVYLSDVVKDTVVYKTKYNLFNTGDSLYRENTNYYNEDNIFTHTIKTSTLDEVFQNKLTFDFIKIDSQGSEIDIINGGLDMCKQATVFLLEASVYPYNIGAPMFDELVNFMISLGFPHYKIMSDIFHPENASLLIQHDVIFTKSELK